jgi:hypothetical protein
MICNSGYTFKEENITYSYYSDMFNLQATLYAGIRADDHMAFVYCNIGSPLMATPMTKKMFSYFVFVISFNIKEINIYHVPDNLISFSNGI